MFQFFKWRASAVPHAIGLCASFIRDWHVDANGHNLVKIQIDFELALFCVDINPPAQQCDQARAFHMISNYEY